MRIWRDFSNEESLIPQIISPCRIREESSRWGIAIPQVKDPGQKDPGQACYIAIIPFCFLVCEKIPVHETNGMKTIFGFIGDNSYIFSGFIFIYTMIHFLASVK
jgi:hypothetical protein